MIRALFFFFLAVGVLSASTVRAWIDVAPLPREIRADGTRDPVPKSEAANKQNPLEVVNRIIKNSNVVGDKLAETDTGMETLAKQGTILKDIQSLIDQQEDPPPKSGQNLDKSNDNKDKKSDMMPMGNMNDMPPMKNGKGGMGDMEPKENDQPQGRRPRQQNGEKKNSDGQPMNSEAKQNQQPMNNIPPKSPGGARPDDQGGPPDPTRAILPFEDEIVKEVWGHLPDKLRQQATQYYKQEFMPRYAELLKHYYSSLSEKGGKK